MTPEQFCYWLQGYAEMGSLAPNEEQWQIIKDHLQLAFKKETPSRVTGPNTASPALPRDLADAVRRFNEQTAPHWPAHQPVITC